MGSKLNSLVKIQGALFLVFSVSMIFPLIFSVYYNETSCTFTFGGISLACLFIGLFLRHKSSVLPSNFKQRDGFFVVSITWLVCSLVGALPFFLTGSIPSFVDAFFESCSGFSTTGASVLQDVEILPKSILFWRSFTHWLGGMGIVVVVIALLPTLGIYGQNAANAETPGPTKDKLTAHFSDTAKRFYGIYLLFTILEVILLCSGGMSLFDSLIHTFGTLGTGGFSNYNQGVAQFSSPYLQFVIILFMILAGMNFSLFFSIKRKGFRSIFRDEEIKFYLTVILVATLLIFACNYYYSLEASAKKTLLDSLFQVSAIMTTTGFSTCDYDTWPTFSKMILFTLFFIGGCSSSTSGGVKCIRILVCLKLLRRSISLLIHPNRILPIRLNHSEISTETVIKITNFLLTYIVILFAGTCLLSLNNFDFMTSLSAAATCIGNIGPGFSAIGPIHNFSIFSDFSKLLCSFLMLIGRLELMTVLALFSKFYWNFNATR